MKTKPVYYQPILVEIIHSILEQFPSLYVSVERVKDSGELFVLIDDEKTYYSEAFQSLAIQLTKDLLWENSIYNILFGFEEHLQPVEYRQITSASVFATSHDEEKFFDSLLGDVWAPKLDVNDLQEMCKAV